MAEYEERKYEYCEELKKALDKSKEFIDAIFESLDGNKTAGVDIVFSVRPDSIVGVEVKLITNGELLKR